MFFYASKLIWFAVQPSSMLLLLFLFGLLLYRFGRETLGIRVLVATVALYAFVGLSPLANAMMLSLEQQYARPSMNQIGTVDGMIVLGGVVDASVSRGRREISLNEAAERVTETAALAYRWPDARIVFAGGDAALIAPGEPEASAAKDFFTRIGIDPSRVTIEPDSRNTWENALFTKRLLAPEPDQRWLLITSAFHMPRAMGVFRATGFEVIPWPVDFRTHGPEDLLSLPPRPSSAWRRVDLAAKEWVGYVVYYMTGRLK